MPLAEKLDPVTESLLNAPVDDEPETEEERLAVDAAKAEIRSGVPTVPHEEVERRVRERLAAGE